MHAFGDTIQWSGTQNAIEFLQSEYAELKQDHIEALAEIERLNRIIQDRSWRVVAEEGNPATDGEYLIQYEQHFETITTAAVWDSRKQEWYRRSYHYLGTYEATRWADILDE